MNIKLFGYMLVGLCISTLANAQTADPKQVMGQIKTNLETSAKNLSTYTWVETITISKDGETKSQTQNQCSIGTDGKIKKVPITAPAADTSSPRGIRGKVVENKKEEMSDYVKKSVAKVQEYLPPAPDKLQAIYASGKTNIKVKEANKKYTLEFPDYLQSGDLVSISLEVQKALLEGVGVSTYLDNKEDKIIFNLNYSVLTDGTEFPAETIMDLPKEGLKIIIKNDGHKKIGS